MREVTYISFEHITRGLSLLEWLIRWVVIPAKVIPYAAASAQWGWRLPWRRVTCGYLWNWRWWLGVTVAALVAVALPARFFAPDPYGSVSAQIWHVSLKLAANYLLAVGSWVLLLAWEAVLFGRQKPRTDETLALILGQTEPHSSEGTVEKPPLPERE
jgi:hypothetical protein